MAWRISEHEFLIQGRSFPIFLSLSVNRLSLPDGSQIEASHEYFRVSGSGNVLEWYRGSSTSTLEECLYVINIHAVIQRSLYEFFWTECYGRKPERAETLRLRNLELVANPDLPFDPVQVVKGFHASQDE
jgi:hypothetical protein